MGGFLPPALVHGLSLPFHLSRVLLSDASTRRRYLRVALAQSVATLGLTLLVVGESLTEEGEPPSVLYFWAKLLATLQVTQWCVVALSRDYHDALGREASLRIGLDPDDGPLTPRVRLNVPWLLTRLKRYVHGVGVVALGMLPLLLASRVLPEPLDDWALSLLGSAWSAWWLVVFTASKSARAWEEEASAPAPWFLRGWQRLAAEFPLLFKWTLLRAYGSLWERLTRSLFAPAACAERQPWAFAGLTLVHALSELPFLKFFLRPLIPISAAHLLVAERARALPRAPAEAALPAPGLPPRAS